MLHLTPLFQTQRELDQRIMDKHQLVAKTFSKEKIMALLVELGELANETRCFKFWSVKGPSASTVILEEYVDGLHFILSLGLDYEYQDIELEVKQNKRESLTDHFLEVYAQIETFKNEASKQNYKNLFEAFLLLGNELGFPAAQIEDAYHEKNRVNHERQERDY